MDGGALTMHCQNPDCERPRLRVIESRYVSPKQSPERNRKRRRYQCPICGWRYHTVEAIINVRRTPD